MVLQGQDPAEDLQTQVALVVLAVPLLSTKTNFISCGHRSWPIKCLLAGSLYQITYRWQCRESDPCPACSRGCPTCPLLQDKEQDLLDLGFPVLVDPTTIDHMEWLDQTCLLQDPLVYLQACKDNPPMDHLNLGLKDPW